VRECAVLAIEDKRLATIAAFVALKEGQAGEAMTSELEVHEGPAASAQVSTARALRRQPPKTGTGKIDRHALDAC
jgi:acyl-coenzyme A synthetase/AMP-(fatty) acid ligase